MSESGWLTIPQTAERLNVNEKTVQKYLREGKLKGEKNPLNGSWLRVHEDAIQELLTGKPAEHQVAEKTPEFTELTEAQQQTLLQVEAAKQAEAEDKAHQMKIQIDLRQKGYDSIEQGLEEVEKRSEEAREVLGEANKERIEARRLLEEVHLEKQKVTNAMAMVKERERNVNEKQAAMIVREQNDKAFIGRYETLKEELIELITYYKSHVRPCVKSLKVVNKTVYSWMDILNNRAGFDWSPLYNFVGDRLKQIDDFTDHIDGMKFTDSGTPVGDSQEVIVEEDVQEEVS